MPTLGSIIAISAGVLLLATLVLWRFWGDLRIAAHAAHARGTVIGHVQLDSDLEGHPVRCCRVRFVDHHGDEHVFVSGERLAPASRADESHGVGESVPVTYDRHRPWMARLG